MKFKRYYEYYAVLTPSDNECVVCFPDLPGAYSQGIDVVDAASEAMECLALHLHGMEEDGDIIPKPSRPENIKKEKDEVLVKIKVDMKDFFPDVEYENRGGARIGGGRPKISGRQSTKRLVVRLTDDEDTKLSNLAKAVGKTKSEYIRDLIMES